MKDDIKKRIIDMLFEPVEDEEGEDRPVERKPTAKELLYGKEKVAEPAVSRQEVVKEKPVSKPIEKTAGSSFIDYIEKNADPVSPVTVKDEGSDSFEAVPNLSPIFGVIGSLDDTPVDQKEYQVDEAQTKKPQGSYLGTVLSPIYGFDDSKSILSTEHKSDTEERKKDKDLDFFFDTRDPFKDEDETVVVSDEIDLFSDFYDEDFRK